MNNNNSLGSETKKYLHKSLRFPSIVADLMINPLIQIWLFQIWLEQKTFTFQKLISGNFAFIFFSSQKHRQKYFKFLTRQT